MRRSLGFYVFLCGGGTGLALVAACSGSTKSSSSGAHFDSGTEVDATFDAPGSEDSPSSNDIAVADVADAASPEDAGREGGGSCSGIADAGAATACAVRGDAAAALVIDNTCAENVDLWWVSYQCSEVFYQQIPAGMTRMQGSFVTHPWRIRLPDAGAVVKDIPPLGPGTTNVQVP